jgi:hypothetical protein
MQHCLKVMFVLLLSFSACLMYGQGSVKGTMQDAGNKGKLSGVLVEIQGTDFYAQTNSSGMFEITAIPYGEYTIQFSADGYGLKSQAIKITDAVLNLEMVELDNIGVENPAAEDIIPTIMLSDEQIENGAGGTQSISGVLNASRDVFSSKVAFSWGAARFRIRGYGSENTTVFMNNIPMNDLESGRPTWWSWSGLNDVMRNRSSSLGMATTPYTLGDIGGASSLDSRAGSQRKGLTFTYSYANRSYNHRLMLTYNSGLMPSGWAFSASGSWRYSENGAFIKGTSYNAASYFVSVEKRFKKQSFSFTAMGAPSVRGKGSPATQEMFNLANSNFYNPNWGYQTSGVTGKKQIRNSRMTDSHQPLFIVTHEANLNDNIKLTTAASYQFGKYGSTALDWYDAQDPRPQYYRNLPSYIEDPAQSSMASDLYLQNEDVRQVNWDRMFEVNRNSYNFVADANGVQGDSIWGNRARYVLEERRYDSQKANFNMILNANVNKFLSIDAGLTYQFYNSKNFKVVEDLLGADFYVDVNRFVERDSGVVGSSDSYQNDLANPNRILKEGDVFGYNYEAFIHKASAWAQLNFTFKKIDFFVGGQGNYTTFWRKGNVQNGQFPDNSLGKSEEQTFLNYSVKGGITYKIDGRNYLYANGSYQTKAPFFRYAYVAARTRDQVTNNLSSSSNYSIEGGYILKAPRFKLKATGYYTKFQNEFFQRSFYLDRSGSAAGIGGNFVNYIMTGIEKQHAGIEIAGEVNLNGNITISAAAAVGEYIYTSRPTATMYLDNDPTTARGTQTIYLENFYIPNTPQMAFNVGVWWRAPKFWSFSFNFSYTHATYADVNFDRRTIQAVSNTGLTPDYIQDAVQPGSDLWRSIINQEQLPGNFTADIYIRKSWKVKNFFFILGFGMSNILNNTNMRTSGFEQFRFDYEGKNVDRFPNTYYYAYGTNYMVSLTFRM